MPNIHLVFMGLIAFMPQKDAQAKELLTAYIVNDGMSGVCDHKPTLKIRGNATIKSGMLCKKQPKAIVCNLEGAGEISLDTEHDNQTLPKKPHAPQPKDKSETDGGSPEWIVRMANVESTAAKLKSDISGMTDAKFSFGWEKARTCAFDDRGDKKVYTMKFVDGQHVSTHRQAVAEVIIFSAKINSNMRELKLGAGGKTTLVNLDCSNGQCPVLEFSNDPGKSCKNVNDHFDMYYKLADNPMFRPRPRRTGNPIDADRVTLNCSSMVVASAVRGHGVAPLDKNFVSMIKSDLGPKPGDRIICPPVEFGSD